MFACKGFVLLSLIAIQPKSFEASLPLRSGDTGRDQRTEYSVEVKGGPYLLKGVTSVSPPRLQDEVTKAGETAERGRSVTLRQMDG